jgi:hypothetical protein
MSKAALLLGIRRRLLVLCGTLGLATASLAQEEPQRLILEQALQAYAQAQSETSQEARIAAFSQSEQFFASALQQGLKNPEVFANLGTAALQAENVGTAIAAFRNGLVLSPAHRRSQQNLAYARSLLPAWVPKPTQGSLVDTLFFWQRLFSIAELHALAAVSFVLFSLFTAAAWLKANRFVAALGGLLAIVWITLTASTFWQLSKGHSIAAVVVADETIARASDSRNAPARFGQALPAGTEVEVLETRSNWSRVRLANDREAWIQSSDLMHLRTG